jgi:hypothetical protein
MIIYLSIGPILGLIMGSKKWIIIKNN